MQNNQHLLLHGFMQPLTITLNPLLHLCEYWGIHICDEARSPFAVPSTERATEAGWMMS